MTKLLTTATDVVGRLSDEQQDDIARTMLGLAELYADPASTNPDHVDAIREGLAQVRAGEFATEEEVTAAFARFRS